MRWNFGPKLGSLFGDWTSDGAAFCLSFIVNNDSCVVFTIDEGSIGSSPGSSLSNDDGWVDFLSDFIITLFARAYDNISDRSSWKSIETTSNSHDCDYIQTFGSRVISTIESGGNGETSGNSELNTDGTCLWFFSHLIISNILLLNWLFSINLLILINSNK